MKAKKRMTELPFTQWAAPGVHVTIDPETPPEQALATLRGIVGAFENDMNTGLTAAELTDSLTQGPGRLVIDIP